MSTASIYLHVFIPLAVVAVALGIGTCALIRHTSPGQHAVREARRAGEQAAVDAEEDAADGAHWFLGADEIAVPGKAPLPAALLPAPWRSGLYTWKTGEFKAVDAAMAKSAMNGTGEAA
jgi:hypothetical protein